MPPFSVPNHLRTLDARRAELYRHVAAVAAAAADLERPSARDLHETYATIGATVAALADEYGAALSAACAEMTEDALAPAAGARPGDWASLLRCVDGARRLPLPADVDHPRAVVTWKFAYHWRVLHESVLAEIDTLETTAAEAWSAALRAALISGRLSPTTVGALSQAAATAVAVIETDAAQVASWRIPGSHPGVDPNRAKHAAAFATDAMADAMVRAGSVVRTLADLVAPVPGVVPVVGSADTQRTVAGHADPMTVTEAARALAGAPAAVRRVLDNPPAHRLAFARALIDCLGPRVATAVRTVAPGVELDGPFALGEYDTRHRVVKVNAAVGEALEALRSGARSQRAFDALRVLLHEALHAGSLQSSEYVPPGAASFLVADRPYGRTVLDLEEGVVEYGARYVATRAFGLGAWDAAPARVDGDPLERNPAYSEQASVFARLVEREGLEAWAAAYTAATPTARLDAVRPALPVVRRTRGVGAAVDRAAQWMRRRVGR